MKTHSIWGENEIAIGDCRDIMRRWIADGVRAQMCVTSPPYFGLRSYLPNGVRLRTDLSPDQLAFVLAELDRLCIRPVSFYLKDQIPPHLTEFFAPAEIGLEQTPDAYVAELVGVFRLVRDLLADDGVLWLNLGDSYTGSANSGGAMGLKPKDLIGIPWRVAFALQADGWYLRQEIIWHKPNPMPESVTDRCTKAHESIFLLAKSERYFFDAQAIAEPAVADHAAGNKTHKGLTAYECGAAEHRTKAGLVDLAGKTWATRNRRSVWTIVPKPYKGAHFATFPPALIEPCILAGSRPGDVVLDPFMGSGTTAQVAETLGRRWLGCELNQDYAQLQAARLSSVIE